MQNWDVSSHVGIFPNRTIRKVFKKADSAKPQFFNIFCSNQCENSRIRIRTRKGKGLVNKKNGPVQKVFVKKLDRKGLKFNLMLGKF